MRTASLNRGPVPLHHQVYLDLRAALEAGDWKPGDRLPPEVELAALYGCSLITVRRALDELRREGKLERSRGRGTFVTAAPIVRDLAGQLRLADEVRALGHEPYSAVVRARTKPAPSAVARGLDIEPGAAAFFVERIRGADHIPLLLEQVWLPAAPLAGLLEHDFATESLWDVLDRVYGLPVERFQEMIGAVMPSKREARLLGLSRRVPAVQLDGAASTAGGRVIEMSRTIVSPDRARFYVAAAGRRLRAILPGPEGPNGGVSA